MQFIFWTEEVPESYWKEIAEQRRVALNDSLHENEMVPYDITVHVYLQI